MKKVSSLVLCTFALALGFSACDGDDDDDDGTGPQAEEFVANLSAAEEVPTNASTATGVVRLTINTDQTISWTMDLTNVRNFNQSHIHGPAARGINAPVRANLFIPTAVITSTLNGRVASGTFGASNVSGMTYDELLATIRAGNAYVNIHTSDATLPGNNTPGDLPAGEIRGQLAKVP